MYMLSISLALAAINTTDTGDTIWLIVGVLAIIALLLFIIGRR